MNNRSKTLLPALFLSAGLGILLAGSAAQAGIPAHPGSVKMTKMKNNMMRMMKDKAFVRKMQEALNGAGAHLRVDGLCGMKTVQAMRLFQKAHGLKVTGMPDAQTRKALHIGH